MAIWIEDMMKNTKYQGLVKASKEKMMQNEKFAKVHKEASVFWDLQRKLVLQRKLAGLTQKDIASQIGVKQSQISRFESSSENCTISTLIAYARAVGMKELLISLE